MKRANKKLIGLFVVGAAALLVVGITVFGSGVLFHRSDKYVLFFENSVKGLSVGAPVIFKGVKLGSVSDINMIFAPLSDEVLIEVVIDVNLSLVRGLPERLGYPDYRDFIRRGLRAKLDMQSFVTGQLMITFTFAPETPAQLYNLEHKYPELPTLPTPAGIFAAMEDVPIKEIADNLNQAVAALNRLLSPENFSELDITLRELTATSRAMRLFMEYLEVHPEALLKGKQAGPNN